MEIAGYIFSILIGVSLGLIGSGGSILTIPVLVYLFAVEPVTATAYSLFIVGVTASIGSIGYIKNGLVNIKTALIFGAPSILSIFLTRAYIIPAIPNTIFQIGEFTITKGFAMMVLFAVMMLLASYKMIKKNKEASSKDNQHSINFTMLAFQGSLIGMFAGLVGAGGGFLIIPVLVLFSRLEMKQAIGTSLLIISANSGIGFIGELSTNATIDWKLLLSVSSFAVGGILIGTLLSKRINGAKLKPAFGWFILAMGIYVIIKELISL